MIRDAAYDDIPALVEMGKEFVAMSPHRGMGAFDAQAVERMFAFLIDEPVGLLLVNGDGFIGGVLQPVYFCPDKIMAEEHFWWARKGGRDLLRAFEKKAREMGASFVSMSTLINDRADIAQRIVTRMGFEPIERRYLKELT